MSLEYRTSKFVSIRLSVQLRPDNALVLMASRQSDRVRRDRRRRTIIGRQLQHHYGVMPEVSPQEFGCLPFCVSVLQVRQDA